MLPEGFGERSQLWMTKVQHESKWVWLGGKGCEMQAELWWEVSLSRLLLFLVVLPVSPALPKQLCAVLGSGCASLQHCAGSLWGVLTCWEAPGVRTGTTGTKELVVIPPQLRCSSRGGGERPAVQRGNGWHSQAGPAEPSPSPVAPWGELELWSSSLIPVLRVWGTWAPSPLPAWQAHCLVSVPGAEATRGAQPPWASLTPSLQAAPSLPCGTLLGTSAQVPASSLPQP